MDHSAKKNQDVIRRFTWEIASISVHLEELRHFWAKTLGISGPQWMIIMALADLDKGEGVPVNAVSKLLHVDPSFVTTQSKLLEKKGFVRRKNSTEDARIVNMSLSDMTYKHLANLASQQPVGRPVAIAVPFWRQRAPSKKGALVGIPDSSIADRRGEAAVEGNSAGDKGRTPVDSTFV